MSSHAETWMHEFRAQAPDFMGAGIPWLDASRERAIDQFCTAGWPTSRQEGWRHTSLALLQQQTFKSRSACYDETRVERILSKVRHNEVGHWLVFIDGQFADGLSTVGSLPEGAQVLPVSQALADQGDLIQDLMDEESGGTSPAALNSALAQDGGFVRISRGVALEHPVHLVFITASPRVASYPRTFIVAEQGASATVVEHYVSAIAGDDADAQVTMTNAVTRTRVASDASVTHMKLQLENEQAFHLASIQAQQDQGSTFNSHSMSFGARLARNDINTVFGGKHCETLFNGLYYVNDRRHVDHNTVINHGHPDGISREYYRGILADAGRGVFGGRIFVAPHADGTDAVQRSDSLLLSRLARADARPELEIYADDVKCAHGATVGQLDDDAMFYLRTRGLDDAHARNLLIYAFAVEAIERISIPGLRQRVEGLIRDRLPGGAALGVLS